MFISMHKIWTSESCSNFLIYFAVFVATLTGLNTVEAIYIY